MKTYLRTSETVTVEDYPYGYLKTSATFGMEWNEKKGYRTTFQTINPKTGRVNAVKKSTYSDCMLMYRDHETGHIKYSGYSILGRGAEGCNKAAKFIHQNFDLFSRDQIQTFYRLFLAANAITAKAMLIYCGSEFEQVRPILEPATQAAKEGIKDPTANVFNRIQIDENALEATKKPDFNPFKVSEIIRIV